MTPPPQEPQRGHANPALLGNRERGDFIMANAQALRELDQRIAIARANLRQLTEQAAAISGGENEDRAAERIARLEQELARLLNEREALKS